jgi:hypothetical protein
MPLADFLCDFDSTGISANRPWMDSYRDGQRLLRHLDKPVTRWRALDNLVTFGFALLRHLFQSFRAATLSQGAAPAEQEVPTNYRRQQAV